MTLITDALDRVARQVSVDEPNNWLSATDLEHVEIRDDFLPETVDEVLERLDLPAPIGQQYTLTGTGAEDYDLPSNFKRLMRDPMAVYETTTVRRALIPVTDDGTWTHLKQIGSTGGDRYFRTSGYEGNWTFSVYREPEASIEVIISYVSTRWKVSGEGTYGDTFDDAGDILLLPRRLIETGIVARWRERKGLDPTGKRREFEAELAKLSNDARARRVVSFGEPFARRRPWDVPVPDQIPTS